jgi:hypothetical protein
MKPIEKIQGNQGANWGDYPLQTRCNSVKPRSMKYQISHLKLEQLVSYFNDGVIDMTPAFQRGRVWPPNLRQHLLKNILQGRPIPAIFLYKKASGPKNTYIILDGKQRLESILLYIGHQRDDLKISNWKDYIFGKDRNQAGFEAQVNNEWKTLKQLSDSEIVKLRDYLLSIIEIDFDENSTLDEMIQLFVDINQYGMKVKRFAIVKALYLNDPLLSQIFELIAIKQGRGKDMFYKVRGSSFSRVLQSLDIISNVEDRKSRVDIMWEKLFEFALFTATKEHRKPVQILKDFIGRKEKNTGPVKLNNSQLGLMRQVFNFLSKAKTNPAMLKTRWMTDQTHFYTLVTSLLNRVAANPVLPPAIIGKLVKFDAIMSGASTPASADILKKVSDYKNLSTKQTTDISKRKDREKMFIEILEAL